jgi:hypothetical protein
MHCASRCEQVTEFVVGVEKLDVPAIDADTLVTSNLITRRSPVWLVTLVVRCGNQQGDNC